MPEGNAVALPPNEHCVECGTDEVGGDERTHLTGILMPQGMPGHEVRTR